MEWSDQLWHDLDRALNEAELHGLHWDDADRQLTVYLDQSTLRPDGSRDEDLRWLLVADGVTACQVALQTLTSTWGDDRIATTTAGPAIPLSSFTELDDAWSELAWNEAMYGWEFVDVDPPAPGLPDPPSLAVPVHPAEGDVHTISWFGENGPLDGPHTVRLRGWFAFTQLTARRPGQPAVSVADFAAAGTRAWHAPSFPNPQSADLRWARYGRPRGRLPWPT